jgi:hypothetical protein
MVSASSQPKGKRGNRKEQKISCHKLKTTARISPVKDDVFVLNLMGHVLEASPEGKKSQVVGGAYLSLPMAIS